VHSAAAALERGRGHIIFALVVRPQHRLGIARCWTIRCGGTGCGGNIDTSRALAVALGGKLCSAQRKSTRWLHTLHSARTVHALGARRLLSEHEGTESIW
jgi:hypothetical protein